MSDEGGLILSKCRMAERMVWMHMGCDDIANRKIRNFLNGVPKLVSERCRAAGVDDRNRLVADDPPDIRDMPLILRADESMHAWIGMDARRDFRRLMSSLRIS